LGDFVGFSMRTIEASETGLKASAPRWHLTDRWCTRLPEDSKRWSANYPQAHGWEFELVIAIKFTAGGGGDRRERLIFNLVTDRPVKVLVFRFVRRAFRSCGQSTGFNSISVPGHFPFHIKPLRFESFYDDPTCRRTKGFSEACTRAC